MPFIDTHELKTIERLPGWKGKYFDSENLTFGHYLFEAGRRSTSIRTSKRKSGTSSKAISK
jgi:hypothetical protein